MNEISRRGRRRRMFQMSLYRDRVLPHLVHLSMKQATFEPYRRRAAGRAEGRVLEIGIGSGLNLAFYTAATSVVGLDTSVKLLSMARRAAIGRSLSVELLEGTAEAIPLPDDSVDTVVMTWTLCSISDPTKGLGEMRRVLKPHGRLLFAEHGRAPEPAVVRWQDRLTPIWKRIGGGCHLNRPIAHLIGAAGFRLDNVQTGYAPGPKPMAFMYEGEARPL
jgi:ubiquinone/menaquinone biosynthesis C-methylase UbiE